MKRNQACCLLIIAASGFMLGRGALANPPSSEKNRVKSAVSVYMGRWIAGDYAAMWKMWDAKTQHLISETQLTAAFQYTLTEEDKRLRPALRKVLGPGKVAEIQKEKQPEELYHMLFDEHKTQFLPRYYLPGVIKMQGKNRATADMQAAFTMDSLTGEPEGTFGQFLLAQLQDHEADKSEPNSGITTMPLSFLAATGVELNYDTALNEYAYFPIKRDKSDPLLMLCLRPYQLIREGGKWKIANAIQPVKAYPKMMDYRTKKHSERTITLSRPA